jgi:DNA-binding CsgD family transcriptional regulator
MIKNDRDHCLSACRVCAILGPLSKRESEVFMYTLTGAPTKVIANEMGVAVSTVRVLIARAAAKLQVRSRKELLQTAAQLGLTDWTHAECLDAKLKSRHCERMGAAVSICAARSSPFGRKAGGVGPQECVPRCASGANEGGTGCQHAGRSESAGVPGPSTSPIETAQELR